MILPLVLVAGLVCFQMCAPPVEVDMVVVLVSIQFALVNSQTILLHVVAYLLA